MPVRRRRTAPPVLATIALVGLVAAACGPTAPALTDPAEILRAGAASLGEMKTLQVRGLIDGELALDLGDAGGGMPLPLDGTTLDADVDLGSGAFAVEMIAPALLNLRVNVIVIDGHAYLRAPIITGDRWVRQPAEGGLGGEPSAALEGLAAFLARPELTPERLPEVRCAGRDCYSVRLTVPAEQIRDALGALGSAIPGLSGDEVGDVSVTVGVRKDDHRLATLGLEVPTGGATPLTIDLELRRVNELLVIEAPPAEMVTESPG